MKKEGIQTRKRKPKAGTSSGAPTEKSSNKRSKNSNNTSGGQLILQHPSGSSSVSQLHLQHHAQLNQHYEEMKHELGETDDHEMATISSQMLGGASAVIHYNPTVITSSSSLSVGSSGAVVLMEPSGLITTVTTNGAEDEDQQHHHHRHHHHQADGVVDEASASNNADHSPIHLPSTAFLNTHISNLPPLEPVMMHGSTLVTRGGSPIGNDGGSNIVIRQFERQVD